MTRTDLPSSWDERTTLTTFLDYARATVRAKCEGITEEAARTAPLPGSPLMTVAGLVNHVRWVENNWFQVVFLGEEDTGPWTEEEPDREFTVALDYPIAQLLDEYDAQSERYRALVAATDLDTLSVRRLRRNDAPVTLRWILFHLVEEIARHNGHLDVVRELVDGTTGV
ncbi:DinB family protein [Catellatospora sp. KI3]|uniref:DinB family protein n=1 Tax=Catellatospora sp. KI3 TaxID=3041620 RepID=UPI002483082F|nr:DinB family protein [Catellatospora sp. KI3]MDI1463812.1 DinB family protein [Catellatospora sp. KI3]